MRSPGQKDSTYPFCFSLETGFIGNSGSANLDSPSESSVNSLAHGCHSSGKDAVLRISRCFRIGKSTVIIF